MKAPRTVIQDAGKDFSEKLRIVTISFDSDDTHEKMKKIAASHATDFKDWKFAVGDMETIVGLARDVGLSYAKVGDKFRHLNFFTIVDTEGKVYKQVYGKDFKPKTVLKYVNMASEKKYLWVRFVNIFDAIKAFCYTYDAKTGRYIPMAQRLDDNPLPDGESLEQKGIIYV